MSMKSILPFEKYTLICNLSIDEIIKRLEKNIDLDSTPRFFGTNSSSGKPYKGKCSESTFSITRVINYRNSFLPLIKGELSAYLNQTRINITMRPTLPVLVFSSIWLGIVGIVALFFILAALSPPADSDITFSLALVPLGMFIFGILLITLSFNAESKKARIFLADLFQGQEMKTN